jgi:hypothetical protein
MVLSKVLKGDSVVLVCGEKVADPHLKENQTKRVDI